MELDQQNILLINFGNFEDDFLDKVAQRISHEFSYPVSIKTQSLDLNLYYEPSRRQFDGNKLLKEINSNLSAQFIKQIGLFNVDLFIPILTYIFGQAIFKGYTGIVSAYRLRSELYGLQRDDNLLLERFTKVTIHELGHTFGLIHCHTPLCVMRSSTYVEDIDQKEIRFCSACQGLIKEFKF